MKTNTLSFAIFFVLTITGTINAASFDCRKATSKIEQIICSDNTLSTLDESLNKAYLKALARADIRQRTIISQKQWLKKVRNTCTNAACIKTAYETRIEELGFTSSFGIEFYQDASTYKASAYTAKPQITESSDEAKPQLEQYDEQAVDREESEDITRSLTMTCDYSDYNSFQTEAISLSQTQEGEAKLAGVKKFTRGENKNEQVRFTVRPRQFAECIYPSGNNVRVKVGEGDAHPYGECGGNPEVFMSLWLNKRKIVSRLWFAGHCYEEHGNPAVNFNIHGCETGVSVEKCHTARQEEDHPSPKEGNNEDAAKGLSVCVDFPDVSSYPKDSVEYPAKGAQTPEVGDIEMVNGSAPVCLAVLDELMKDSHTFSKYPDKDKMKLSRPDWHEISVQLPDELKGSSESIFDFNNDGKLDRVFSRTYENTYMDGSVLLVQPGLSSSKLVVSSSPIDNSSLFLPFQIGKVRHNIRDYPPFSQKNDEAGFSMQGVDAKEEVHFRGRYSDVSPFNFAGTSYIAVNSMSEITKYYVAVLKPMPDGTFQNTCLLRRITENF